MDCKGQDQIAGCSPGTPFRDEGGVVRRPRLGRVLCAMHGGGPSKEGPNRGHSHPLGHGLRDLNRCPRRQILSLHATTVALLNYIDFG